MLAATRSLSRLNAVVVEMLESRLLLATYYVATNGSDTANGTSLSTPWATVQKALNTVVAGDTVYFRGGTYRQTGTVQSGHYGSPGNLVTLAAYANEVPIISGSNAVTGWVNLSGNIWKKTGWITNSQQVFDDGVPLQQIGMPNSNTALWPTDGSKYTPVGSGLGDMAAGRFYYDSAAQTLYVQLADNSNPNNSTMEASVRRRGIFADPARGYIKFQNLTFQHTNAAAETDQDAALTVGSNSIVDGCTFRYTDLAGLSLGWNTTGVQVTKSIFASNGCIGLQGPGSQNFTIEDCTIISNNYRNFNRLWHAGGIKVTTAAYGLIDDNNIGSNNGSGIWFDFANGTNTSTVRDNYIHDNGPTEAGIFFEASKHVVIYNNVLVNNNRRGIFVHGTDDTKIYNNTIVAQQGLSAIEVLDRSGVDSTNTILRNNIISGSTSSRDIYMDAGAGNSSNYNDIYRSSGAILYYNGASKTWAQWQALGFDLNSTTASPAFASQSGDSYPLASGSPAVNTGTALTEVTVDYVGTSRPSGPAYDMGAYEFVESIGGSPVAHYAFDESAGTTTADASGNGNTGTLNGGTAWTTPGKVGAAALSFDGVNDRVDVPDSSSLDASIAVTIGGWFYHNSTGGTGTSGIDKDAYRLTVQQANAANSQWQFYFKDTNNVVHTVTTMASYSNNAWHHVMGTFDGATLRIYVDGIEAATPVSFSGSIINSSLALTIGRRHNTSYYYAGKIDDVRVYNRALSASEVAALASSLDSGLAAYYRMEENSGTTTADASGNGNTGTLNGGVAWTAPGYVGAAALSFDGVNDRVDVADSSSLDVSTALTIGGWFYHNSTGGTGTSGIDKDAYRLTVQQANAASSQWQFHFKDTASVVHTVTTANSYTNNAWHHVVGTYNGSTLRIYVDGVEAATPVNFTGSILNSSLGLTIGRRHNTSYYYAGKMDDIRIYNRALSASEVAALYGGGGGSLMASQSTTSSQNLKPQRRMSSTVFASDPVIMSFDNEEGDDSSLVTWLPA